jgi:hypothetical protein
VLSSLNVDSPGLIPTTQHARKWRIDGFILNQTHTTGPFTLVGNEKEGRLDLEVYVNFLVNIIEGAGPLNHSNKSKTVRARL